MIYDEIQPKEFIDKNKILEYVTEEQIFELVFGFKPKEYQYVTSPLRDDNNPGCWFERSPSTNKLRFIDFANTIRINNMDMVALDCFDVVRIYYNHKSFYETLKFINDTLISGKKLEKINRSNVNKDEDNSKKTEILFASRNFYQQDKEFWSSYHISKQDLINDKVFAVYVFKIINKKSGEKIIRPLDITYCYTDFSDNKKKIYRPNQDKYRFITNCGKNDIGGIDSLPFYGEKLIISKSYKDYRVLKNQGCNVVWFQNEGMIPSDKYLVPLLKRFQYVTVFFDNDETGIKQGKRVTDIINSYFPNKVNNVYLPESLLDYDIKDPSDLVKYKGLNTLSKFVNENKLL